MEDWALIRRLAAEGESKVRIAARLGISRTTVIKAVSSESPPRYERKAASTSFSPFEARVRELLTETPGMPATVLAERVGRSVFFVAAVVIAAIAQLVVGYFYLVSGLVTPIGAVALFLVWWLVLTLVGVLLMTRRSYLVLLVPVVAVRTWFGVMWFGGAVLGWGA